MLRAVFIFPIQKAKLDEDQARMVAAEAWFALQVFLRLREEKAEMDPRNRDGIVVLCEDPELHAQQQRTH